MRSNAGFIVFALALVLTAFILSNAFKNRNRAADTISVTGMGSKDFVSDLIVWSGSFVKKNPDLKAAYSDLDKDREIIRQYLISKGITSEDIVFSSVDIMREFDESYDSYGNRRNSVFTGYRLNQNVQIESREVNKIEGISRQVSELINMGVEFYSNAPQYYYTQLAELKIEMIAEATKDAHTRAEQIAKNAGSKVGKLKKANMGVFQIIAQNSSEDFSWGGSFNTMAKNKTATITMKLEYGIK
jgi:uncharacterized protein